MADIFLSYRWEDSAGWARLLFDRLTTGDRAASVFYDAAAINPGHTIDAAMDEAMRSCQVVLPVIGPRWLESLQARLDSPEPDRVRWEVRQALDLDKVVIPVLVEGAAMPPASALPPDIRDLTRRVGTAVGVASFDSDAQALVEAIGRTVPVRRSRPRGIPSGGPRLEVGRPPIVTPPMSTPGHGTGISRVSAPRPQRTTHRLEVLRDHTRADGTRIQLCHGDLARMDPRDGIDVLVISSFRDSYLPTEGSVIGALADVGISVEHLSRRKAVDLRESTSCWLSTSLDAIEHGFRRLVCYEPDTPGSAASSVGDVFRALTALIEPESGSSGTVAMPLLATGSMGRDVDEVMRHLLAAASRWVGPSLGIGRLLIVVKSTARAAEAARAWDRWLDAESSQPHEAEHRSKSFDLFISYARSDGQVAADSLLQQFSRPGAKANVFLDRQSIDVGAAWQQEMYDALAGCRHVVALLSPGYLASPVCIEEFNIARLRQREEGREVLLPLYILSAALPPHMRVLNHVDCREADLARLAEAADGILERL